MSTECTRTFPETTCSNHGYFHRHSILDIYTGQVVTNFFHHRMTFIEHEYDALLANNNHVLRWKDCCSYLDRINSPSPKWMWAWMSSTTLLSEMRRGCRTLYSRRIYTTLALVSRHDIAAVHTPPVSTVAPATTCKLAFLTLVNDDSFWKSE